MKKRVVVLILLLSLIIIPLVLAADDNSSSSVSIGYEKAYDCLKTQLGEDCAASANTEQNAFSLLAMAYDSNIQGDCKTALENKKKTDCWGKTSSDSCDLKSTSQAILALDFIGKNVDDNVAWLESKKKQTTGLIWFLEIDANEATSCKIKTNGANEKTFTINENKKVSGTSTCLTPAENNYFLKISDSCLTANFTISCDKDFITTLLYKKTSGSTYYVSSLTNSAPTGGSTEEKVNAYCFSTSAICDYEGSLWATIALAKVGKDISPYLPYLSSMYDEADNQKYFPSAFLYMLTNEDDYQAEITGKQKQGKYWDEAGNKFYDTSLALLALQNVLIDEVSNAKDYLLTIQDTSGCWHSNNVRDTAFILYAAWPKNPVISSDGDGRSGCTEFSHYCVASEECSATDLLDNFYCSGLSDICCAVKPLELSCKDKGGLVCETGYECTGSEVTAGDTNYCCMDSCIEVSTTTECEDYGSTCRISCLDDEEEKTSYSCNLGDVCCAPKASTGMSWTLIILLIVLIILVILAIIFRNQLKIWLFRAKSGLKFSKSPTGPSGRPPMNPPAGFPQMMPRPRQIIPRGNIPMRRPPMRPAPRRAEKDTAFDETMRKLREMSK